LLVYAHASARGRPKTTAELERAARTRHERGRGIGTHEVELADALRARGISFDQQTPCGAYNLDFTLEGTGVAVELVTSARTKHTARRAAQRLEYVLDRWHLLEVRFRRGYRVLEPGGVDEIVTFAESHRFAPAVRGEHRMVWPNGHAIHKRRSRISIFESDAVA